MLFVQFADLGRRGSRYSELSSSGVALLSLRTRLLAGSIVRSP